MPKDRAIQIPVVKNPVTARVSGENGAKGRQVPLSVRAASRAPPTMKRIHPHTGSGASDDKIR